MHCNIIKQKGKLFERSRYTYIVRAVTIHFTPPYFSFIKLGNKFEHCCLFPSTLLSSYFFRVTSYVCLFCFKIIHLLALSSPLSFLSVNFALFHAQLDTLKHIYNIIYTVINKRIQNTKTKQHTNMDSSIFQFHYFTGAMKEIPFHNYYLKCFHSSDNVFYGFSTIMLKYEPENSQ